MSFPCLLPRIALAPARSASSSSFVSSSRLSSSARSLSSSISSLKSFSIHNPTRSLFASSSPPRLSRSYSTPKTTSKSKPRTASPPSATPKLYSPRKPPPPPSPSSTPPSTRPAPSSSPKASPTRTKPSSPATLPPRVIPTHLFLRWEALNARPRSSLSREEKQEKDALSKQGLWAQRIELYRLYSLEQGYVPMDGSSSNAELKSWWEEVGKKTLKGREVWDEFVVTRPVRSPSSSPNEITLGTFKPTVDDGFRGLFPLSITLGSTFLLYLGAAYATQEVESRCDPSGAVAVVLGPFEGWLNATLFLGTVASAVFLVKAAGSRPGSSRSLLGALDRFFVVDWTPFRRSYAHGWALPFGHADSNHLFANLRVLVLFGFLAYPFFDERGLWAFLKQHSAWPYLLGIPGSINSSWAISGPSDEVAEPKKTSIGAFHFLVFCVATCVVEPVIRQVHHSFIVLPRAQKQILRLLQNPSEVRSLTPAWFFIPKAKKIYLAETIQATFKAQGTVGMSLTPFALSSLSFLQMAVNWHPIYLPFQYYAFKFIKKDLQRTYETRRDGVNSNHNTAILFGVVYFFVGDNVWEWFLDKASRLRTWLGIETKLAPPEEAAESPVRSKDEVEVAVEEGSLIG
ncbi:hypothetical protein BDY24DRAFT_377236 [Mrakia frigida]|uniref:uncharacterized protein n=1 Tax=Mrakia frigida TaxID=29902 RepID=UPI003FCC04E3